MPVITPLFELQIELEKKGNFAISGANSLTEAANTAREWIDFYKSKGLWTGEVLLWGNTSVGRSRIAKKGGDYLELVGTEWIPRKIEKPMTGSHSGNPNPKEERTALGSKIIRGFSFAGSYGGEYSLMEKLYRGGYEELYYDAPYYWGLINVPEKKIYTYTEGDTALIECDTYEQLLAEAQSYINFLKEHGYGKTAFGEWESVEKKIKSKLMTPTSVFIESQRRYTEALKKSGRYAGGKQASKILPFK